MNIQQFYEEKERAEQEKEEGLKTEQGRVDKASAVPEAENDGSIVIPVVEEEVRVGKEELETSKITVQKRVVEIEKSIDVPLQQEGYEVKRVPIGELIDEHPAIRQEGDRIIVPVVEEVLVVQKRLRLVEEVHLVKQQTTVTKTESFIVKKEEVVVERTPIERDKNR